MSTYSIYQSNCWSKDCSKETQYTIIWSRESNSSLSLFPWHNALQRKVRHDAPFIYLKGMLLCWLFFYYKRKFINHWAQQYRWLPSLIQKLAYPPPKQVRVQPNHTHALRCLPTKLAIRGQQKLPCKSLTIAMPPNERSLVMRVKKKPSDPISSDDSFLWQNYYIGHVRAHDMALLSVKAWNLVAYCVVYKKRKY